MWSSILAKNAPGPLSEGSIGEDHVEDLLGLVRSSRMPMNLVERRHRTARGVERRELGKKDVTPGFPKNKIRLVICVPRKSTHTTTE
jgi:hypothetical protein